MNTRCEAGAEMARLRREKKLTQAELAQILSVSQRMIAACEAAERMPSPELAQRIEQELELPWTAFYQECATE